MILLAIDSAGESSSAALWDQARPGPQALVAWRAAEPGRGHSERLIELVETVLADAGVAYDGLGALAVSQGPGSFTGVRSAVAAVRGLALAAGLGVVAVSSLETLAAGLQPDLGGEVLAAIDARRGEVYAQRFGPDLRPLPGPLGAPRAAPPRNVAAWMADMAAAAGLLRLVGSGAHLVEAQLPAEIAAVVETIQADARLVALCAARRLAAGERPVAGFTVRPLYLRAPDARLPENPPARRRTLAAS